jgi:hypothetical protein
MVLALALVDMTGADSAQAPATGGGKKIARPELSPGPTIIQLPDAHVRDPSCPQFFEGRWHCYATRVPINQSGKPEGDRGTVWHFSAETLEGPWQDRGPAVLPAEDAAAFDSLGTFTPDIIRDPADGRYYLFYTATKQGYRRTPAGDPAMQPWNIGMCVSDSPDGPFRRSPGNPILQVSGPKSGILGLRLDEAMPMIIADRRVLFFRGKHWTGKPPYNLDKCVALARPSGDGWEPPYRVDETFAPVPPPFGLQCHEAYTYFPGPDGMMHLLSVTAWQMKGYRNKLFHFTSADGLAWTFDRALDAPMMPDKGGRVPSPHVVWEKGCVPGDQGRAIGVVSQWDVEPGRVGIRLFRLSWKGGP